MPIISEKTKNSFISLQKKSTHIITNSYTLEEPLFPQLTTITRNVFLPSTLAMNVSKWWSKPPLPLCIWLRPPLNPQRNHQHLYHHQRTLPRPALPTNQNTISRNNLLARLLCISKYKKYESYLKGKCYCFRQPGHWTKDCPQLKGKIQQICSLIKHIDEEETAMTEKDFQEDL